MGREREGWVPACARTTEGEGMTGEGVRTSPSIHGGGRSVGTMGRGVFGGKVERAPTRDAPTGEGGKGARGTPLRGKVERGRTRDAPTGEGGEGRARGAPLRGKVERAPTRGAPTGEGGKGLHEGRPYGGRWKGLHEGRPYGGRCGEG